MSRSLASFASLLLLACGGPVVAADGGADTGTPHVECAARPAPLVAGTAEADALADAAARCGQPAHAWLRDASLGEVIETGSDAFFGRTLLAATARGANIVLPRAPEHDVVVRTYRYRTQDRGALIEATAAVAFPEHSAPGETLDAILLLHGTSGFKDGCGASTDLGMRALAAVLASWGHVVVLPDYIGLAASGDPTGFLHPYLVGQATAIASLDALRAALRMSGDELGGACLRPRFVTMGGSQGGHAALWVDRLAPYYARELEQVGVVATVPPSDLVAHVERALVTPVDATSNTIAFYGASSEWYGLRARLSEVFVPPWDVDVPAAMEAECSPSVDPPSTLDQLFTSDILAAASEGRMASFGPWGCMLTENSLISTSVAHRTDDPASYGILIVTGEADTLVHTPIERDAFRTLCEAGQPVRYLECTGAGHVQTTLWSFPETLRFMEARLAGEPFERPATCEPPPAVTCEGTPSGG